MEFVIYDREGGVRRAAVPPEDLPGRLRGLSPGAFAWIDLTPAEQDILPALLDALGAHPPPLPERPGIPARPRRERSGDHLCLTLRTVREAGHLAATPLRVHATGAAVVTVGDAPQTLRRAHDKLAAHPRLLQAGPDAAVLALTAVTADGYDQAAETIRARLRNLEERVFAPGRADLSREIYRLKRDVLELGDILDPMVQVTEDLLGGRPPPAVLRHHLRDLAHHVRRVNATVTGFDQLLNSVAAAHLASVSNRQNEDMRRISAWAAVLAVPTVVASIYGMNFEDMPELTWKYGYLFVWLIMAGTALVVYLVLRHRKWL